MDAKELGSREVTRRSDGHMGMTGQPLYPGLTLRQHFAGLAMQGILANEPENQTWAPDFAARRAVEHADALLAELAKET